MAHRSERARARPSMTTTISKTERCDPRRVPARGARGHLQPRHHVRPTGPKRRGRPAYDPASVVAAAEPRGGVRLRACAVDASRPARLRRRARAHQQHHCHDPDRCPGARLRKRHSCALFSDRKTKTSIATMPSGAALLSASPTIERSRTMAGSTVRRKANRSRRPPSRRFCAEISPCALRANTGSALVIVTFGVQLVIQLEP